MQEMLTPEQAAQWLRSRVTGELRTDNRLIQAGDGFLAWPGAATDARQHVAAALAQGASACLVEGAGAEAFGFEDERVARYSQLKAASGPMAADYFGRPSEALKVVAVTGTNGKTSVSWWLAQALSNLKQVAPIPCGLVGTFGMGRPPKPRGAFEETPRWETHLRSTGMTTPDPVLLQHYFQQFVREGDQACAIEASSIGIEERRLDGTRIHTAVFTNLTQDHLDYHGSMSAYGLAKAKLFAWPGLQAAVINVDDVQGAEWAASLGGTLPALWTVSCVGPARLQARGIHYDAQGLRFTLVETLQDDTGGEESHAMQTRLIGTYNVANVLGVLGAMRSLGVPLAAAVDACHDLTPVPGRMECIGGVNQPLAAVDYAHTPDAIGKALEALRPLAAQRGGQLWCVLGCGGDRDASKRPLMGAMAACHADHVVVTSDNPRGEKPEFIISQILLGLSGHQALTVLPDRAEAIAYAIRAAAPEDVLLIAGKGHEDYQEVAGTRLPFSDAVQVRQALAAWTLPTAAKESPHD